MYNYNVQPCHIRCLIILGGDTTQILNNLREEDNLRREDKSAVPKVSSLRRFHCINQANKLQRPIVWCAERHCGLLDNIRNILQQHNKLALHGTSDHFNH